MVKPQGSRCGVPTSPIDSPERIELLLQARFSDTPLSSALTDTTMPSMQELCSICNSRRCYNNPLQSVRFFFFVLFTVISGEGKKPNLWGGGERNHDMKSKKKRQPCGGSGLKDPKKCYTSKRMRGDFLHTPGARAVFEGHLPFEFENIQTLE